MVLTQRVQEHEFTAREAAIARADALRESLQARLDLAEERAAEATRQRQEEKRQAREQRQAAQEQKLQLLMTHRHGLTRHSSWGKVLRRHALKEQESEAVGFLPTCALARTRAGSEAAASCTG